MHPDRAIYQHTLGVILMALDRLDEAAAALRTALAARPEHPALLYNMALLFERQGLHREAGDLVRPLLDRVSEMEAETYEGVRALLLRVRESNP